MAEAEKSGRFGMGRVALTVHDLDKVGAFYENAVGLTRLSRDGENASYGAGDTVLLELRQDRAARRRDPREAGLFHTAFLLPERGDLGRYVLDLVERRVPVAGASDHAVSEALYLTDPEGNGVEVYSDRPAQDWVWRGESVHMVTEPLDLEDLARAAGSRRWQGAPGGTRVGHVHLQVGALPEAEAFYAGTLGLDITCHVPGGSFFSADRYHHHLAANVWNSRGAPKRSFPATGLAEVEIRLDPERAEALSVPAGGREAEDPWGTKIALRRV